VLLLPRAGKIGLLKIRVFWEVYNHRHRKLNGPTAALIIALMVNSVDATELNNITLSREAFERRDIHTKTIAINRSVNAYNVRGLEL